MKNRKRNFKKPTESPNFWPSFTDVMSTIVLVFFFLILLAYFQQIISLSVWNDEKNKTIAQLDQARLDLDKAGQELDERKLEISEKEDALRILAEEQELLQAEVDQGQKELMLSLQKLQEQEKVIANSNEELAELRAKLVNISVLRVGLLEQVKEAIEEELGETTGPDGNPIVSIGTNANLVINNSVLFDSGSSTISADGKQLLKKFAVAFQKILDEQSNYDIIDSISIDGHADYNGDYASNYNLSCERATAVVTYMMEVAPKLEYKYGDKFSARGFSEFRPIDLTYGDEEAYAKNRRIEISINIQDSHVQNIIEEYLNN